MSHQPAKADFLFLGILQIRKVDVSQIHGMTVREIDHVLCKLDGTPNKAHLGANATLAVSMAAARAIAAYF